MSHGYLTFQRAVVPLHVIGRRESTSFLLPMARASLLQSARDCPLCMVDSFTWNPILATVSLVEVQLRKQGASLYKTQIELTEKTIFWPTYTSPLCVYYRLDLVCIDRMEIRKPAYELGCGLVRQ
jgi:hypothetical protein